ncbi:hypothetical protein [Halomicrobium salinisoli]|uniref:hypothetical protein n=1 Tax=Halomicrobium salinisoli TaxID=2878391 RepID=UPI001CF0CADE|nr:hypothetical protein [Halomicrobium salinisoli]
MYEPSFIKRLSGLGASTLIKSYDTFAGVLFTLILYFVSNGSIKQATASSLLSSFSAVSAGLFAIILTGLTIITSFTDKEFLYAWQKIGEFENLVTYFQYNLFLPVVIILSSIILHLYYHPVAMILLIGLFVYFLFSLLNLMALTCRYALQRGEFIRQQLESSQPAAENPPERLTKDELKEIEHHLNRKAETSSGQEE